MTTRKRKETTAKLKKVTSLTSIRMRVLVFGAQIQLVFLNKFHLSRH